MVNWRFEQKLVVPPENAGAVATLLAHACLRDRRYQEDVVCSWYFDSKDIAAYEEVLNGDIVKEKIRLRWYESSARLPVDGAITGYLEAKKKEGFRGTKKRLGVALPWRGLRSVHAMETDVARRLQPLMGELGVLSAGSHHPVVLIRYRRARFFDPFHGLHITLDTHIKATHINARIMKNARPAGLPEAVLEIKGDRYAWPRGLAALDRFGLRNDTFSKYARCIDACRLGAGGANR